MTRKARVTALVLVLAATGPVMAQDNNFKIFGAAAYVSPLSDTTVTIGSVRDSVEESNELGWAFGFEWRWGKLLGLEVDYINSTQDVEFGGTKIAEVDFSPISASLNIHVIHTKLIDFYVGPTASYVDWGDIEVTGSAGNFNINRNINTDSELSWGAQAGIDIGLGDHLAVTGGIRWLKLDLTPDQSGSEDLAVDPLISRVGLAWRF